MRHSIHFQRRAPNWSDALWLLLRRPQRCPFFCFCVPATYCFFAEWDHLVTDHCVYIAIQLRLSRLEHICNEIPASTNYWTKHRSLAHITPSQELRRRRNTQGITPTIHLMLAIRDTQVR